MLQSFFFLLLEAFAWFSPTESMWFTLWLFDCAFTTLASVGTFLVRTSNLNHLLRWGKGWKGLELFAPPCLCIAAEVEYTRMTALLKFKFHAPSSVCLTADSAPTYLHRPAGGFAADFSYHDRLRQLYSDRARWGRFVETVSRNWCAPPRTSACPGLEEIHSKSWGCFTSPLRHQKFRIAAFFFLALLIFKRVALVKIREWLLRNAEVENVILLLPWPSTSCLWSKNAKLSSA